jgi:hypothetical protein
MEQKKNYEEKLCVAFDVPITLIISNNIPIK